MIFILFENPRNVICPVLPEFYKRYPESSRIYLDTGKLSRDNTAKLSSQPLLNDGWLILCPASVKLSNVMLAENSNSKNLIFIKVNTSAKLTKWQEQLDGCDYKIIDNYKIKRNDVIGWIITNCSCSLEDAGYLYKRVGGRVSDIVDCVQILKMLPVVKRWDINKYTSKSLNVGVHDLVCFLLGTQRSSVKYDDCIKFVYEFRFAYSWLLKSISKELADFLCVFSYISNVQLSLTNYKEKQKLIDDKALRKMSEFRLKEIIEAYNVVSTEYLFFMKQSVDAIEKNMFAIYKLINLLNVSKEDVC